MALLVAAGVLLVAVLMLLFIALARKPAATPTTNTNTTSSTKTNTTTTTDGGSVTNTTTAVQPNAATVDDYTSITRLARNFTERYSSYSTDTHYENIEQSRWMMTPAMSTQADKIIAQDKQANSTFYSVSSQATNVTVTDFVAGATGATVAVEVRQTMISGQSDPTYQNRTARLTLQKDGAAWKVDSFRWI